MNYKNLIILALSCSIFALHAMQKEGQPVAQPSQPAAQPSSQPAAQPSQPVALPSIVSVVIPEGPRKHPDLIIRNDTDWKIILQYGFTKEDEKEPYEKTLVPKETYTFKNYEAGQYSLIRLVPSGKYLGKTQYRTPENLIENKLLARELTQWHVDQHAGRPDMNIQVNVSLTPEITKHLESYLERIPGLRRIAGIFKYFSAPVEQSLKPFNFIIDFIPVNEASVMPKSGWLSEAFPGAVYDTQTAHVTVKLHHILGVPEGAKVKSIDKAYNDLKSAWEKEKEKNPKFVELVLLILRDVHIALREKKMLEEFISANMQGIHLKLQEEQLEKLIADLKK